MIIWVIAGLLGLSALCAQAAPVEIVIQYPYGELFDELSQKRW